MIKKRITFWYILWKTINFVVPNWLFNFLKKYPFIPLILVILFWIANSILVF